MKKIILVLCFMILGFGYVRTEIYEKEDNKLKVGTVHYQTYSLKELNARKAEAEIERQESIAYIEKAYNEKIAELDVLIAEAGKLGVTLDK